MKQCTGCGRIDNEPLGLNKYGEPFLACCPDNNYVEMKQKTAMMELIDHLSIWVDSGLSLEKWMENYKHSYLEKEKEQIIDAYAEGHYIGFYNPEDYYNQTYLEES